MTENIDDGTQYTYKIRSFVISLGDDEFIFSEQKIFVTYLRNTMKENFKNVKFLE